MGVWEGLFHKDCSSQDLSCYCNLQVSTGKERNLHAVNSLSVDAQFFAPAGEFTLDSCCMCGETCKKHGNTGCSCVENESKRDVACVRRCPKTSNEKHHLLNNLVNNIHVLVNMYMYKRVHRYITINIDININHHTLASQAVLVFASTLSRAKGGGGLFARAATSSRCQKTRGLSTI